MKPNDKFLQVMQQSLAAYDKRRRSEAIRRGIAAKKLRRNVKK